MTEHIVAVFDSEQAASAAVRELEQAGIPSSAIRKYAAGPTDGAGSSSAAPRATGAGGGFWAWILGEEAGATTRDAYPDDAIYSRHASAGNTVVNVTLTDDAKIHQAITILDAHYPLNVEESTEETTGAVAGVAPGPETGNRAEVATTRADYSSGTTVGSSSTASAKSAGMATNSTADMAAGTTVGTARGPEQVIPLSEEELNVGTRQIEGGVTRVRRYIVSRPVEKEVTLHGERVTIERRQPVSGGPPGASAFEERVVEVRETEEVPVVEKTARVVEEVAIRRETTERTETVRDTVRREELEVAPDKRDGPARRPTDSAV